MSAYVIYQVRNGDEWTTESEHEFGEFYPAQLWVDDECHRLLSVARWYSQKIQFTHNPWMGVVTVSTPGITDKGVEMVDIKRLIIQGSPSLDS